MAAFFDEMVRWGVARGGGEPGSRSTALAMAAYELEQRRPQDLRVYVDIDERGAAFLGLGLAKASGSPVALVCTLGHGLGELLPGQLSRRKRPGAAHRSVWRPAPQLGPRRAADHRPAEGLWQPCALPSEPCPRRAGAIAISPLPARRLARRCSPRLAPTATLAPTESRRR